MVRKRQVSSLNRTWANEKSFQERLSQFERTWATFLQELCADQAKAVY